MARRSDISRRQFIAAAAPVAGAFVVPMVLPAAALGADSAVAPSNRITIGMIGVGRQVLAYNLPFFMTQPDAEVVALCDVDRWRLDVTDERSTSLYGEKKNRCGKIPK